LLLRMSFNRHITPPKPAFPHDGDKSSAIGAAIKLLGPHSCHD
jgi:hypothetical protein